MDTSQLVAEAAKLRAEWEREDPHNQPMTADEYDMMRRHEACDFPDDQERLTSKQTRDLMGAWFKRDKAAT